MNMKKLSVGLMSVFVGVFGFMTAVSAAAPVAPTVVQPEDGGYADTTPIVAAIATEDADVYFYVDGEYNTKAYGVSGMRDGVKSVYAEIGPLTPGEHVITAMAIQDGDASGMSAPVTITVEPQLPRPTVYNTVYIDENATWNQPWILGVAPSESEVAVYIDGIYHGTTTATEDESGVGSFAFRPGTPLAEGSHTVSAKASRTFPDGTPKVSPMTSAVTVEVTASVVVETKADEMTSETEETTESTDHEESDTEDEAHDHEDGEEADHDHEDGDDHEHDEDMDDHSDESSEDESDESAEEGSEENSEESSDEDGDSEESGDEAAASADESDDDSARNTLSLIGWAALIIAALIVVFQMQRRRDSVDQLLVKADDNADGPSSPDDKVFTYEATSDNKNVQKVEDNKSDTKKG